MSGHRRPYGGLAVRVRRASVVQPASTSNAKVAGKRASPPRRAVTVGSKSDREKRRDFKDGGCETDGGRITGDPETDVSVRIIHDPRSDSGYARSPAFISDSRTFEEWARSQSPLRGWESQRGVYKGTQVLMRKLVPSGSPFESRIGFSRDVKIRQIVAVSGTAPIAPDGTVACPGDVYVQTRGAVSTSLLRQLQMADLPGHYRSDAHYVDRYLTIGGRSPRSLRVFRRSQPASTFIEVNGFVNPEWLVNVEADCVAES